jgi:HK97 family phage major capsid protein
LKGEKIMNEKLKKLYAKSDSLMARIEELQAKETLTAEEDQELTAKVNECEQVENEIDRAVKAEQLKEKRNKPENKGWRPGAQIAAHGITKDFKDFGDFLMNVKVASVKGPASNEYERLIRNAASGANETVDADGGFLVQTDFVQQLMEDTYQTGILPSRCQRIPISSNSNGLTMNGVDESSRADGSRYGGIQAYWEGEADQLTGSKPKFRKIELKLKKLTGLCYATDEVLQDASALGGVIQRGFASEFGFKLDDAIIRGSGVGQPLGILNSGCLVTVAKEAGQAADTVVFENIIKMYARCNGRNPEWYINRQLIPQLALLQIPVGTGGAPVFIPANGAAGRPYNSLLGLPINMIEQCSALGDAGDIILASFNDYLLADKGNMESAVSIHVRFLYAEQAFRFILRIDGQPLRASALTPYKGSDTLSSFVTLAERA